MAQDLIDKIREQAQARGLNPETAVRIAQIESSLDPSAKAKTSTAQGLFQVVDRTWREFGGKPGQKANPDENIRVGLNILESNTKSLRSALGRDPSPSELYAAHFLGAEGAKSVLAAKAETPVSQLLSERAIKANPTLLQGKKAGELVAALEAKMGGQGPRTTAPAQASRAAPAASATPAAPRAAPRAAAPVKQAAATGDLGAGYQAALALSFLGDEEDEGTPLSREERMAREEERSAAQMLAEYKPRNVLSEINWDESSLLAQAPTPKRMADGGEVKEPSLVSVPGYSETVARDMYPGQQGQFDQQDAARHMLASGTLARKYGPGTAEFLGNAHEIVTSPMRWIGSKLGVSQMPVDYEQDLHNNRLGIELARRSRSQKELEDLVQAEAERAAREKRPGAAWIGRPERPVKRAEGSPPTGEVAELTPEEIEAASRPAFVTSRSGIGRKISLTSGQVNDAVLQGVAQTPYNLVGAPVDVVTLALRPLGYAPQAPVMGSEWLKQQATRLGIRPETPTQPTARALYEMGQLGASVVNPAAPVRAAAAAVERAMPVARAATPAAPVARAVPAAPAAPATPVVPPVAPPVAAPVVTQVAAPPVVAPAAAPVVTPVAAAAPVVQETVAAAAPVARPTAAQALEKIKKAPATPAGPIFSAMPTPEAPFISRLDEFVANLQSPVRKDQFLGQLKGKFREYDINRAEAVLADLPASAKLSPADLLNRLKSRYDPADMRTTVREPMDNAYFFYTDNPYTDRPVGVIHLSSFTDPVRLERIKRAEGLNDEFIFLRSIDKERTFPKLEQIAQQDPEAQAKLDQVFRFRQQAQEHLRPLMDGIQLMQNRDFPVLALNYSQRLQEIGVAQRAVDPNASYTQISDMTKDSIRREATDALTREYGRAPKDRNDLQSLLAYKLGDQYEDWANQGETLELQARGAADAFRNFLLNAGPEKFGLEEAYRGKSVHGSLKPPPNAVGFSRFVEQTSQDPDRGPLKGIHLLEIQSDLTSELKKGKVGKDKEVFPNMAENRRVVQQLGIKNAISAALNRGDQFVTFPGKESEKPQLYESVRDNLKQVAKDLGPGFEVRPFTFRDADGYSLQHWGITWGPEAAARVQKQGVPFKDGGMVERQPQDSRKYL
jgi:hypothetical protein